jgi:hypothetical protein
MAQRMWLVVAAAVLAAVVAGALAGAHPERPTVFPDRHVGGVPAYRTSGPSNVVCKADSRARIKRIFKSRKRLRDKRLKMLKRCRFHDIQAAINAAKSGYRILIMPGVYQEQPSRAVAVGAYHQPPCADDYVVTEGFVNRLPPPLGPSSNDPPVRPDRNYQVKCPNSKNLIAVIGDPRPEPHPQAPLPPQCLQLCNLQIEGMGRNPQDVLIVADRKKLDVLRVDRANGIYLRNFTVEQSAFNGVDLVEVNGFVIKDVVARYNQDYGILTFTAVHGLYDHDIGYGNGDSGLYPGSTEKGCDPGEDGTCDQGDPGSRSGCGEPSIEIRNSLSYGNAVGYSGTAGNSTYLHDNKFFDNSTGLGTDSFVPGHPGFPQECVHWVHNEIYSNNVNLYTADRQDYCTKTPFVDRPRTYVCPQFQWPVGTGIAILGGNRNLIERNFIYDNWRYGAMTLYVPAAIRMDLDPAHQMDTGNGNQFISNYMGLDPAGNRRPNGLDFAWDGAGQGNCWQDNTSSGRGHTSDPASLPTCPGRSLWLPPDPIFYARVSPCALWDPKVSHFPPGCDWFTTPPRP